MGKIKTKKILIVDDSELCVVLAKKFLESVWIAEENIAIVHDGIAAVEKAKEEIFDAIIMDIRLPNLDGIQASQEIKSHHQKDAPKIIAYTADVFLDETIIKEEIFDAILYKPVKKDEFAKKLLEVIGDEDDKKIE